MRAKRHGRATRKARHGSARCEKPASSETARLPVRIRSFRLCQSALEYSAQRCGDLPNVTSAPGTVSNNTMVVTSVANVMQSSIDVVTADLE